MNFLYILLFLLFLSILIIVHELGHLFMAKAFKVYCLEYSIGMGPLLFKRKRKNGETQFSLRAIPFGGYVSMYGEGVELPEGVVVDESRSLNGIKPWKRALVLLAGVTMNALLALVFFGIHNCFPFLYRDQINVVSETATIPDKSVIKLQRYIYNDEVLNQQTAFYLIDNSATINGDETTKYAVCLNYDNSYADRDLASMLYVYHLTEDNKPDFESMVSTSDITYVDLKITTLLPMEGSNDKDYVDGDSYSVRAEVEDGKFKSFGFLLAYGHKNFGEVITSSFEDFGTCSIALFKAVGDLVINPKSWGNVGGLVAVGYETTSALQNYGFGIYIFYWGFISVNLAVFNLLPFPGLDGWQLLVLAVESIFRKKIPEKAKNIVSLVGIGLLLALMVVVLVKDLLSYTFHII